MLKPNVPTPEGAALGRELARFVDVEIAQLEALGRPVPKRCGDCAFRLGTQPNECAQTVLDATMCALRDEDFFCHLSSDPEGDPTQLCRGLLILRGAR